MTIKAALAEDAAAEAAEAFSGTAVEVVRAGDMHRVLRIGFVHRFRGSSPYWSDSKDGC